MLVGRYQWYKGVDFVQVGVVLAVLVNTAVKRVTQQFGDGLFVEL